MKVNNCISVFMTPEIRMFKALEEVGVEDPKSIVKLTISGKITQADLRYIAKKMGKTLLELDMGDASIEDNYISEGAFSGLIALTSVVLPKSVEEIESEVFVYLSELECVGIPGKFLLSLRDEYEEYN